MARNGSGVYSLPAGSTVANGDTSDATDINTPFADLETDANTVRPIVAGGTGASSTSAARTNLGVAIGTDVQAQNATLATIASQGNVDTSEIADDAITSAKLADDLALPGVPTAPTASPGTNTTQVATTAFVRAEVLDEDDFASDSATRPPSQQSVGAYIADQIAANSWVTMTPIATTSGSTADFAIPAGVTAIKVILDDVSLDGGGDLLVQLGTSSTPQTTGYASMASAESSRRNSTAGFLILGGSSVNDMFGHMLLDMISTDRWIASFSVASNPAAPGYGGQGGGGVTLSDEADILRLTTTADDFDTGSVTVKYLVGG